MERFDKTVEHFDYIEQLDTPPHNDPIRELGDKALDTFSSETSKRPNFIELLDGGREIYDALHKHYKEQPLEILFIDHSGNYFGRPSRRLTPPLVLTTVINGAYGLDYDNEYGDNLTKEYTEILEKESRNPAPIDYEPNPRKIEIESEIIECITRVAANSIYPICSLSHGNEEDKAFLRSDHARELIKTGHIGNDWENLDSSIDSVIFQLDNRFPIYGINNVILNEEYIERVYGDKIDRDDLQKVLEAYSDQIDKTVVDGFEKFLKDPFFRKERCESLTDDENTALKDILEPIWDMDNKFWDSPELIAYLKKISEGHPEIYFSNENDLGYVESFSSQIDKVVKGHLSDYLQLAKKIEEMPLPPSSDENDIINEYIPINEKFITALATELEIKPVPSITYLNAPEDKAGGYYSKENNTITINLARSHSIPLFILVLTHEMWHAHQYNGANVPEEHRELYHNLYISHEYSYQRYRQQLTENEAFLAGELAIRSLFEFLSAIFPIDNEEDLLLDQNSIPDHASALEFPLLHLRLLQNDNFVLEQLEEMGYITSPERTYHLESLLGEIDLSKITPASLHNKLINKR
ncbi:MAG: hypothetical protein Q4A79_01760 [Candidatus Saccharibacteria bacterium]|nr:hypothetical protein [Candidatus Saccharibacteria bacterium]